jgi:hypothetical protein
LSKAAGDWPFAISELDRISSWRVHSYIQGLLDGKDRGRAISTSLIWQTPAPGTPVAESATLAESPSAPPAEAWKVAANLFLKELRQVVFNGTTDEARAAGPVNRLLASWDSKTDALALAEKIFENVVHRQNVAVHVSSMFAAGTADQARVSLRLDELL